MPHIHGVAWIEKDWLKERGIEGFLTDHPDEAVALADELLSCELPQKDPKLKETVAQVQTHNHTKSCLKYNGICRYGFPRTVSPVTLLAQPLPSDMDPKEKESLKKRAKEIIQKAKELLNSKDIDENMDFETFYKLLGTNDEEYIRQISITERGKVLILKRTLDG